MWAVRKLIRNEFPITSGLFGQIIHRCWYGKYDSIHALEQDILQRLDVKEEQNGQRVGHEEILALPPSQCRDLRFFPHSRKESGFASYLAMRGLEFSVPGKMLRRCKDSERLKRWGI